MLTIHEPSVAAAVAAATNQTAQRAALIAPWTAGGLDVTVRSMNGATVRDVTTYGPWLLDSNTPRGMTLGALLARTVSSTGAPAGFEFRAGATLVFSMSAAVSPATADLVLPAASGGILASARTNLADQVLGKVTISADPALPVTEVFATALTLSVPNSGTNGSPATVTVTPNGPIPAGGLSVTLAASNGGVLGSTSLSFTAGATAAQTTTLTRATAGSSTVAMTNSGGLTNTGSPATYTSVAPGATVATLTLTSPTTASAPFSVAQAFKQGDIPAGSGIVVTGATAQAVVKNTWPDGSAKIALISGTANLTANTPATVSFGAGAASTGTALTTADLKTAMALAHAVIVDAGAFGSASWFNTDWDIPFQTWVAGHRMSSWIYRKPVGGDAHLVAWLEVRLFAGGAVEFLPWIENGYLNVASPTSKSATYSFTLGAVVRFSAAIDLPARCRTPLVSGSALTHWLGTDPEVVPRHSAAYMQATELVPTYRASVPSDSALLAALPTTFTPLQQGSYSAVMGQTGYQPAIGLLPEWDVLYLTSTDPRAYKGMVRNAYSAGRFAIHYRDEATNRPLRFSQFPNLSTNSSTLNQFPPTAAGTSAPVWDVPHHPSLGYMAYLVTGSWYFMEELQFAATRNYLAQVDSHRFFSGGVFQSESGAATVRGAAWAVRTLAQAAVATPDADSLLRAEFLASLTANIDFNHSTYVATPNNPFGIVAPYGDAYGTPTDGKVTEAPWQQDFYTAAFGYALSMKPGVLQATTDKLAAFFAWKAKSVVGRLGGTGANEWLYRDAAVYNFVVAPVDTPDWSGGTGPWFSDWGALYSATYGVANPGAAGDLRGGNFPEASSYWGNMQPAIAYAVRHAVPGASAAYLRMTGAGNWAALAADMLVSPVWSVRPPAEPAVPAWASGLAVNQWAAIPGTALATVQPSPLPVTPRGTSNPAAKISAWCGATIKRLTCEYIIGSAGGHADYAGNEISSLRLLDDVPRWVEAKARSADIDLYDQSAFNADMAGASTHTYQYSQFIDSLDTYVSFTNPGTFYQGPYTAAPYQPPGGWLYGSFAWSPALDWATKTWRAPDWVPEFPGVGDWTAALCVPDPRTGDVYIARSGDRWRKWTAATRLWSSPSANTEVNYCGGALDTKRNRMLIVGGFGGTQAPRVRDIDGNLISVAFGGLGAAALATVDSAFYYGRVLYDEANDRFLVIANRATVAVYTVNPVTWEVALLTTTGDVPAGRENGMHNAPQYVPNLNGISGVVLANTYGGNVYFLRTA